MISSDLCIALNGPHVASMLPVFCKTLKDHVNLDGVTVHFISKNLSSSINAWLENLGWATIHYLEKPPSYPDGYIERDMICGDVANTCEWIVRSCGSSPIVFLCHFDVVFRKDLLSKYREAFEDSTLGQAGEHRTGLVGYRRTALTQTWVGFRNLSSMRMVQDHRGLNVIYSIHDARLSGQGSAISGCDIGELLQINLGFLEWGTFVINEYDLNIWRGHCGDGSGRCIDSHEVEAKQADANLVNYGLEKILE